MLTLKDQLIAKGLTFEASDKDAFRTALSTKAGFYKEWRDKFGERHWKRSRRWPGRCHERGGRHAARRLTLG